MATKAEIMAEAEKLRKEAKVLDLCEVAQRTTEKLAEAQKTIEDLVGARECFNKKAAHAAKVLAGCGAIENDKVGEFVSKVAEDPSQVWGLVEKMAGAIPAPTLGEASDFPASRSVDDPWLKAIYGISRGSNGYVD